MPEDPTKNPMLEEYESSIPGDPFANLDASKTSLKGEPSLWEHLKRPGLEMTGDSRNETIKPSIGNVAKLAATGLAGLPGGPIGSAFNLGQALIAPSTVPPAVGVGNVAEAATGALPAWLRAIPGVDKLMKGSPKIAGGLMGMIQGGATSGANAYDRGGDVETSAKLGALLGGPMGVAGSKMHEMTNALPSPTAERIDNSLAAFSGAPMDAVQKNKQATSLLSLLSGAPAQQQQAQKAGQKADLDTGLQGVFTRMADKFRPQAKGAQTAAAEAKARFQNAGTLTDINLKSDIDVAHDFLKFDYRPRLVEASKKVSELENVAPGIKNFAWYKKRMGDAQAELDSIRAQGKAAQDLTRRQEASAARATSSTINAEAQGGDMAKNARDAQMVAGKQNTRLSGYEGAANASEKTAIKATAERNAAQARFQKVFDDAGINPADMTPEATAFINKLQPKQNQMTTKTAIDAAMSDPSHAEGLRHILEKKDPEMLNSIRGEFLFSIFERERTGKGGRGAFPQIYRGEELAKAVDKLNTGSVNALFNDKHAHNTLREIAEAAEEAEKLAKVNKIAGGIGTIGGTSAGYLVLHSLGRTVTDPVSAAALAGSAASGYFALNVPRFIEANIQSDGAIGRLLTQYLKSKNPEKLPAATIAALSKIGTAFKYPATGNNSSKGKKPAQRLEVF